MARQGTPIRRSSSISGRAWSIARWRGTICTTPAMVAAKAAILSSSVISSIQAAPTLQAFTGKCRASFTGKRATTGECWSFTGNKAAHHCIFDARKNRKPQTNPLKSPDDFASHNTLFAQYWYAISSHEHGLAQMSRSTCTNSMSRQTKCRLQATISADDMAIIDSAKPANGSIGDGVHALVRIALRADTIERQNRELSEALASAMNEMALALREIRAQVTRLEAARG